MKNKQSYLTPKAVAELLMVSTATIRLWTENGDLKSRLTAGGHRRFMQNDIDSFAQAKNIELNIPISNQYKNSKHENKNLSNKILIVDDEQLFAEFLQTMLNIELKNVKTEISLDGFDAANKLRDFSPDIVLLDLHIPGLNGFKVCKHIKQTPALKHIRVIAISGELNEANKKLILKEGAEACFEKPLNKMALLTKINSSGKKTLSLLSKQT
ncbi:MAG: response regulator [Alteromonadaceae bacterium]|nr:response regulator [Alteromonadaceae bacterium]